MNNAQTRFLRQFIITLLVLVIPLFGLFIYRQGTDLITKVRGNALSIYEEFDQAAKRVLIADYDNAADNLQSVRKQLESVRSSLWFIQEFDDLLTAADDITAALEKLTTLAPSLEQLPQTLLHVNSDLSDNNEYLAELLTNLQLIQDQLDHAADIIHGFPLIKLTTQQSRQILAFERKLTQLQDLISRYRDYLPAAHTLLGYDLPQTYLILLQNNNELRPGGGFIGSLIIADFNDGHLTKLQPYDSYVFDGQLVTDESQPEELSGITSRMTLHDSNTSPDFPTNAIQARRLLEESGGPTVDNVIAINQSVIEDLLEIIGPITLANGVEITNQNFSFAFTALIESSKDQTDSPKNVLFSFVDAFTSQLGGQPEKLPAIINILRQNIVSKNLFAHSNNATSQAVLASIGLAGSYPDPSTIDELLITHTSIGGNKSDRFLDIDYQHETEFAANGDIIDHLTITLTHGYSQDIEAQLWSMLSRLITYSDFQIVKTVLGRGNNVTRLKVYAPAGSQLQNVTGLDAGRELTDKEAHDLLNRHLFSYVTEIQPGATSQVTVSYLLPKKLKINPVGLYQMQLFKAPGVNRANFTKTYNLPTTFRISKAMPEQALLDDETAYKYQGQIHTDSLYQAIISQK